MFFCPDLSEIDAFLEKIALGAILKLWVAGFVFGVRGGGDVMSVVEEDTKF